jgi:phosphoribosyl 1,2-cyclic phosphodiesterase
VKIISLSSGSSGNCYLVQSNSGHTILIDCGLTARKVQQYLAEFGLNIAELSAIFLTHDHSDHLKGAGTISQRWGVPVYANPKTLAEARLRWEKFKRLEEQRATLYGAPVWGSGVGGQESEKQPVGAGFTREGSVREKFNMRMLPTGEVAWIGDLQVSSFPVSHDAADTVCYTIREDERQATILTDLGCATDPIFEPLCHSDLLILEANHCVERLRNSRYPYPLKARIFSDRGHLSNLQSGGILREVIEQSGLGHTVWLAHLSQENNHPDIAKKDITNQLEMAGIKNFPLHVAKRDKPSLQWNGEPTFYQMSLF